ncbi:bZIP transcription factor [Viridibacillus arvi]|uniref:bZIP transcription factor n=1 Tax=Viridibacillus arvi TaxID=263475 RepID=UPI00187B9902|nr:bZIP transcription factor [Viridibacillus sp. JNUCC-6]QOV09389.1 hypothetical protein JNUCC6_11985 [Viridibacillus sp. JNUCC-6]
MKLKWIPIVLGAALLVGCGSDTEALEKKVNTLQRENNTLKQQLETIEKEMTSMTAKINSEDSSKPLENESDLSKLDSEVTNLITSYEDAVNARDVDALQKLFTEDVSIKKNNKQIELIKDGQSPIPIVSEINSNVIYEVHIEWFNYDGKGSYWIRTLLIKENEDSGAEVYFTIIKTSNGFKISAIES